MINFDDITGDNTKEHDLGWSNIPDHPYRLLTTGGFGSWKTNTLLD